MHHHRLIALFLAASLVAACSGSTRGENDAATSTNGSVTTAAPERKYLLERVDDAAVVQLYADGFDSLPLDQKLLIWHLYQATIAGRDIFIDQKHRSALEMRGVLEQIVARPQGVDPATLPAIQRYTKLFWINNGPYNNLTARKFVLATTPQAFLAAAQAAARNGATFATRPGESLEAMLARLQPMFFDPDVDPIVTNKTPGPGKDILLASANNLYAGVSMADLKGFTERNGLNSRLVKRDGKLIEEVYKVGGMYGPQLAEIVEHLEAAIPHATPPMAHALRALVQWYRTGSDADRAKYDIAWVQDKASPVDTINGFIEVYLDPRGVKGSWEGVVFYVNQEKTARIRTLAESAQWFEDRMPWNAAYRKPNVTGIVANAIDVVVETGDAGPTSAVGINLPNDQRIREQYGSKSVSLTNIRDAGDNATPSSMRSEFSWSPEEADRAAKFSGLGAELTTDMHEVIGHASGRQKEGLAGTPQALIKEHFSALEEGRADLIALYWMPDPKLLELGIFASAAEQENVVRAEYEAYTRNALVQLRRVREGTQIEEDHMRNRQMVVRWLMANTKAIEERTRDGKHYLLVTDTAAFREGVGRLLADVQRIKSEGDAAAAAKLFDTYGIHFDPALRDEIVTRVDALNLASYTGFVMPKLTPVTDANGKITDVRISYPMDLTTQMLEWSGLRRD
ncbi:MAG: peptidase M49 [Acidimicrobiia bacterium]|nr:peptidase M49 [Acidimicrobiia bacterium]